MKKKQTKKQKAALTYFKKNRSLIILHTLYQRWGLPTKLLRGLK